MAGTSALAPAVSGDWLHVDTTAAEIGYGPAVTPGPDTDTAAAVPGAPNPLAGDGGPVAPDSEGYLYDPEGAGPWPSLPAEGTGKTALERPEGGLPQGGDESLLPRTDAAGMWADALPRPGHDASYQVTDTEGWAQYTPTGRVATIRSFGQANPENNPTWPPTAERPVEQHLALRPVDFTADDGSAGTPGIAEGSLPDWSMTGGQGNTAYETPGPPPVSQPVPVGSIDDDSGWA